MTREIQIIIRHIISSVGSLFALLLIWAFINPAIELIMTGDLPDVMFLPESGPFNCCYSIFWIVIVLVPFSTLVEFLFVRQLAWPWWLSILVFGGINIAGTFIVFLLLEIVIGQLNWDAIALSAVGNVLMGVSYWVIFRLLNRILVPIAG